MGVGNDGATPVPRHPVPQMQGAFEESMRETLDDSIQNVKNPYLNADKVQRRKLLLEGRKYERTVGGRWIQRRGENFHPLWKLVAQISFGMHLLQSGLARSDEEVIRILQSHVDEVDGFLERTTEDFELAQHDINERIKYLRLPLEHGEVFDTMLGDKTFRSAIVDGNEKIEHIVSRTTIAVKDALKDVQKGLDGTRELQRFLSDLSKRWTSKSEEHEAVYSAMTGNTEGWNDAFKSIQDKGGELGHSLVQLGAVISEIQRRAGIASRKNLPASDPQYTPQISNFPQTSRDGSQVSSNQPSKRVSTYVTQSTQTKTSKGPSRSTPPMMTSIPEQQDSRPSNKDSRTQPAEVRTVDTQPRKTIPLVKSPDMTAGTQNRQSNLPVELPGDSRPNPRMSIHAMMTMEALSKKSSLRGSQKSDRSRLVDDEDEYDQRIRDEEKLDEEKVEDAGKYDSAEDDEEHVENQKEIEPATGQSPADHAPREEQGSWKEVEPLAGTQHLEDPFGDENDMNKDELTDPMAKLHEEIINSFAAPKNLTSEALPPRSSAAEAAKSPQIEGQTFFGYASSEADTGSIDARSSPGKGRSRSTTDSQVPHAPKAMILTEHPASDQDQTNFREDEEGIVNHKHPIFQDIRSRGLLSDAETASARPMDNSGLEEQSSEQLLPTNVRKNSFRASDSSTKRLSKSDRELESPVEIASNRNSNITAGTPTSLRGTGTLGDGAGVRVRDASRPETRPKTQIGQAPPIAPHPIQTSGLQTKQVGVGGDRPPSPSLAELTSATVSGPDMVDPFAMYSPSSAPRHKHQELLDRLNGALQENARAAANAGSPTKQGRSSNKNHKKSSSEIPQHSHSPTGQTTTMMTTTTTTHMDSNGPQTSTYTTGSNTYMQTVTTATLAPTLTASSGSSHGRSRTLSPFSAGGMIGRNRDRTPEKESGEDGKKGIKKFFSMKKNRKDTSENF